MKVITAEIRHKSRSDVFRLVPLGDIHIGAQSCDENLFKRVVKSIAEDPNAYWFGMGDYCDFINRRDPRFDVTSLADFLISKEGLGDITKAQRDRFLALVKPIAHKCLALIEGNHETAITRHTERKIFEEIVMGIKGMGIMPEDKALGLGYTGWLRLQFKRQNTTRRITINLHHGFVGGRLAGAKALNMQRYLWTHEADVVVFGHSHNKMSQNEAVQMLDLGGNLLNLERRGIYGGTFNRSYGEGHTTYAEVKGYFPLPTGVPEILVRPGARNREDTIRIIS